MNGTTPSTLGIPGIPTTSLSLEQKLTHLKLGRIRQVYQSWLEHAAQHQLDYAEFLDQLLTEELLARQENQMRRRMAQAAFPYAATLEQFDFSIRPELKRTVIMRFFDSSFVEKAGSLILIGASGLGKTHLAIAVGTRMVQLGYDVRFVTAQRLANAVMTATSRPERERLIQPLIRCDLLILDEFGYLPLEVSVGPVLYEIISGRYEKGATVVTSNKSLANWGELVGGDSALMMALVDRLLHHGEVFYLRGTSYRMRGKEPLASLALAATTTTIGAGGGTAQAMSMTTANTTTNGADLGGSETPPTI
jgi:DNA replication protein DnaC